jgi:phage baseplate assembly protein V
MSISRGVVEAIKDDKGIQLIKADLFADENRDNLERFQNYGFTCHPHPGGEMILVCPGGNRENGIVISVENREFRLKNLAEGEVALYTDEGDKIHFKRGNIIEINGAEQVNVNTKTATVVASTKVDVDSPLVELGDGTLEKILNGETFQTRFNQHQHLGNLGVATGPPIVPSPPTDLSETVKGAK